jgi:hypothetical protein
MAAINVPAILKARIDSDPFLVGPSGIIVGLVWTQPFRRDKTREVFRADGQTEALHYNLAARCTRGLRQSDFFGAEGTIPGAEDLFPEVRFMAEAHDSGKMSIEEAGERCMQLFDDYFLAPAGHAPLFFRVIGFTPPEDSEDFKGASVATLTLQVKSRWTTVSSY